MATKILFFGSLREAAGAPERVVDLPGEINTSAALVDWLCADDDHLKTALTSTGVRISVDLNMINHGDAISDPSEIAFMAPFSGG